MEIELTNETIKPYHMTLEDYAIMRSTNARWAAVSNMRRFDNNDAQLMLDAQTFPLCALAATFNKTVDVRGA